MGTSSTVGGEDVLTLTHPQIHVDGVVKRFAGRVVVDVDRLVLGERPIEGLLGPNGAGKTTLMRMIMHSLPLDAGTVTLVSPDGDDQILSAMPAHRIARRGVIKSTQVVTDFEQLTILDSMLLALAEPRHERPWRLADEAAVYEGNLDQIAHWLDFFEFGDPTRLALSAGERKLLDIIRCLLRRPAFLLLDEPTAGLPDDLTAKVMEAVREMAAAGTSVVIIEHDLDVIWELCDVVTFMAEGQVLLKDEPAAIRANPTVVRKYLGDGHV